MTYFPGAFQSPQLLMLSGIGPKDHLEELGIPVLRDLPVGQHLQDHFFYVGLVYTTEDYDAVITIKDLLNLPNILQYAIAGTGPYNSLGGIEGVGFIKTNVSTEEGPYPDIEILFAVATYALDYGIANRRYFRIARDYYDKYWRPFENKPAFSIYVQLTHPKSTGYMKLRSRNPFIYPKLYGNYFKDPGNLDMTTMIAGVRYAQKIAQTKAFDKYGIKMSPIPVPGCEQYPDDSDEYWDCAIRTFSVSAFHHIGTAKMGPADDPEAVVDNKLRLYGVDKLRVADCSVVPLPPAAHMNAPAQMIGEKAADLIKEAWNGVK